MSEEKTLSRRVAEEQGWMQEGSYWVLRDGIWKGFIKDYHPDTDIAQAMAFAEWAGAKLCIDNCDDIWTCTTYSDDMKEKGWAQAESFAECICEAVLAALEK